MSRGEFIFMMAALGGLAIVVIVCCTIAIGAS